MTKRQTVYLDGHIYIVVTRADGTVTYTRKGR
jgi:hypothetical protein